MKGARMLRWALALAPIAVLLQMGVAPLYAVDGVWLGLPAGERITPDFALALALVLGAAVPTWSGLLFAALLGGGVGLLSLAAWEAVLLEYSAAAIVVVALSRRGWGARAATRHLAYGAAALAAAAVLAGETAGGSWGALGVRLATGAALDALLAILLDGILQGLASPRPRTRAWPGAIRV